VGSNTDGIEVRSVGNSAVLKETCLIEALNLKAAIEYVTSASEPAKVSELRCVCSDCDVFFFLVCS
jgi:hypothetical protein